MITIRHIFELLPEQTDRLNRIEAQLKLINKKLDILLSSTAVPTEQLAKLTQDVDAAKLVSDELSETIEKNK